MAGLTKAQRAEKAAREAAALEAQAGNTPNTEAPELPGEVQNEVSELNTPIETEVISGPVPKLTGKASNKVAVTNSKERVMLHNRVTGVTQDIPAATAQRLMSKDTKNIFSIV